MNTREISELAYKIKSYYRNDSNKIKQSLENSHRGHKDSLPRLTHRKNNNLFISNLYKDIGEEKASERVANCSKKLVLVTDNSGKNKVCVERFGCNSRFCPICQMIRARQNARVLSTLLNYLMSLNTKSGKPKYSFMFITPTTPDVAPVWKDKGKKIDEIATGNKFRAEVDIQNLSATKLIQLPQLNGFNYKWVKTRKGNYYHKKLNGRLLGSTIKVEATLKKNLNLNSHNHILAVLHGTYFKGKYYLRKSKWIKLWNLAVSKVCHYCLNTSNPKMSDYWHRLVASDILATLHKSLASGKGGLNIGVQQLYYKKPTTWLDGTKHLKKIKLSQKNAKKVIPHVAKEVSKYETKSQDLMSLAKHGIPKKHVVNIFKAMTIAFRGIHGLKFFGVMKKSLDKYKLGKLDKFTEAYQHSVLFNLKECALFHSAKKKIDRYYSSIKSELTDEQKIYFRLKFHLPTTYTTDERHNHFHSKHDEHIKAVVSGELDRKKEANHVNKALDYLDYAKTLWRKHIIWGVFNDQLHNSLKYHDDAFEAVSFSLDVLHKCFRNSNFRNMLHHPTVSYLRYAKKLYQDKFSGDSLSNRVILSDLVANWWKKVATPVNTPFGTDYDYSYCAYDVPMKLMRNGSYIRCNPDEDKNWNEQLKKLNELEGYYELLALKHIDILDNQGSNYESINEQQKKAHKLDDEIKDNKCPF